VGTKALKYCFKNGRLHIEGKRNVLAIEAWPAPAAMIRRSNSPWDEYAPTMRLVEPYRRKKKPAKEADQLELGLNVRVVTPDGGLPPRKALEKFRFQLPKRLARDIEKLRSHQWHLIRCAWWYDTAFYDLLESTPSLAYALANCRKFVMRYPKEGPRMQLREVLLRKRDQILEVLDLPPTRRVVNLMVKICPQSLNPEAANQLRDSLFKQEFDWRISHLERINAGVLCIANQPRVYQRCNPKLLHEISRARREDYFPFTFHRLQDIQQLNQRLRPQQNVPVLQSLQQCERVYRELREEAPRQEVKKQKYYRFKAPPIPGTESIIPLTTSHQLYEEGRLQRNCVADYVQRVQAGYVYIYRVLEPQRATLSIVRTGKDSWGRGELQISGNRPTSLETKHHVDEWLGNHQTFA
jgi:hypothetical protein